MRTVQRLSSQREKLTRRYRATPRNSAASSLSSADARAGAAAVPPQLWLSLSSGAMRFRSILLISLLALLALPAAAAAVSPAGRVLRYWTPARMASARPLDLVVDRSGRAGIRVGPPSPAAAASFLAVPT